MVERAGKETVETRYYILSIAISAKQFGKAVRCNWGIESMHWILDVTFKEDESQITKGHGPENFGFLRRFVIWRILGSDPMPLRFLSKFGANSVIISLAIDKKTP